MKKIIFNIATIVATLIIILVACNKPDKPFGEQALLPEIVVVSGPEPITVDGRRFRTNTTGDSTVVLTAISEGATLFDWRNRGAIIRDDDPTAVKFGGISEGLRLVATGYFPDVRVITVAGANKSGTGRFSARDTVEFRPWRTPDKPVIDSVVNNVCPTYYTMLYARARLAESFRWYRDGVPILVDEYGDTAIDVTTRRHRSVNTGVYTVRGINHLGEGPMSDPVDAEWEQCIVLQIAEHTYTVTGYDWMFRRTPPDPNSLVRWENQVIEPLTDGTIVSRSVFLAKNWYPQGHARWVDNFILPPNTSFTITIHRDFDGDYYIPYGVNVGIPGIFQTWIHLHANNRDTSSFFRFNTPSPNFRLYLEVAYDEDGTPEFFRIPRVITISVGPEGAEVFEQVDALPALLIWQGPAFAQTTDANGDLLNAVADHVFTIENNSNPADRQRRIREAKWVPAPAHKQQSVQGASSVATLSK
jgi:hypothetical protein